MSKSRIYHNPGYVFYHSVRYTSIKIRGVRISDILLERRFVACVNYLPIESAYWWWWAIAHSEEIVTLYKTRSENWEMLKNDRIYPPLWRSLYYENLKYRGKWVLWTVDKKWDKYK